MITRWQLRASFFTRPGPYTLRVNGDVKVTFTADKDGVFEVTGDAPTGLGIYAKPVADPAKN